MTSAEGRHAEIARRYKSKQADKPPISIAALRIAELRRLFLDRYGRTLPDDDAGRDDVMVMAHHLARRHTDPERIHNWIELNAPWMAADESGEIVRQVVARPFKWRADKLAARLRLTEADRRRLRIRTIGAVDMTKQERQRPDSSGNDNVTVLDVVAVAQSRAPNTKPTASTGPSHGSHSG
jgi:hypothetical protein